MQNSNQFLLIYLKTLKNRPFFRRAPLKMGFLEKKSEIRRQAKKIFVFTPSNALKTPPF